MGERKSTRDVSNRNREPSWIASFAPQYEDCVRRSPQRAVSAQTLDEYIERSPETLNQNPETLNQNLTRKNLLDLLCFQELNWRAIAAQRGMPAFNDAPQPEEVTAVNFGGCTMNWIPVDELKFLFRNLDTVTFKNVGGKIDLRDLINLPDMRVIVVDNLPITEFPYFLSGHRQLTELSIFNTNIESVDFTNQKPFTAITTLTLFNPAGGKPILIKGLAKGFPSLQLVCVEGPEGARTWTELTSVYPRKIEIFDLAARRRCQ